LCPKTKTIDNTDVIIKEKNEKLFDYSDKWEIVFCSCSSVTPSWMAPECIQGNFTLQSDIYSYGLLLLYMWTGFEPSSPPPQPPSSGSQLSNTNNENTQSSVSNTRSSSMTSSLPLTSEATISSSTTSTSTSTSATTTTTLSSSLLTLEKSLEPCPLQWRQLIQNCLQENPTLRPQSFKDLLQHDLLSQKLQILLSI
jgi:hypothetical protein